MVTFKIYVVYACEVRERAQKLVIRQLPTTTFVFTVHQRQSHSNVLYSAFCIQSVSACIVYATNCLEHILTLSCLHRERCSNLFKIYVIQRHCCAECEKEMLHHKNRSSATHEGINLCHPCHHYSFHQQKEKPISLGVSMVDRKRQKLTRTGEKLVRHRLF